MDTDRIVWSVYGPTIGELTMRKSKKLNGINGAAKTAGYPHEGPSRWRPHLSAYKHLLRLVFADDVELDKAVDLLWTDALYELPHDSPDGKSIVIPADALASFEHAGLRFTSEKLQSITDFSPEEIAALRRS